MKFEFKNMQGNIDIKKAISEYSVLVDITIHEDIFTDIKLCIGTKPGQEHQLFLSGFLGATHANICVCDLTKEDHNSLESVKENRKIADFLNNLCPESLAANYTVSHWANWED